MENTARPGLKGKAKSAFETAKKYWRQPAEGNYVSYKEIAFLSGAGFGVHWLTVLASSIGLSATNYIVGPSIGLEPMHLQIMLNVANIIGIPIGIFRSWYYDNHNLKGGKFLPFIQKSALPIFLLSTLFVWLPYERMDYITKAVVVEVMYLAISIAMSFYTESYNYFQQIITPDSQERSNVMSISQIVYSLAPTITNAALPALAGMTWGRDNIWTYRVTLNYANNLEGGYHAYNVDLIEALLTVSANGDSQDIFCRNTYSLYNYKTLTFNLKLNEGENTVRLSSSGNIRFNGNETFSLGR